MSRVAELVVLALIVQWAAVNGSDVNRGKKVPCFEIDGAVLCPGCNQRAGLTCPRALKTSRNCLNPSTEKIETYSPTPKEPEPTSKDEPDRYPTTTLELTQQDISSNETVDLSSSTQAPEFNDILQRRKEYSKFPIDEYLYLNWLLGHRIPRERYARDVDQEETCDWNADCACPLICCKTGPGCPKICVKGIRLPPPWG